jgi:hypothetical protein
MSLHNNTVPQVLYNTSDPHSKPSELYVINGTVLEGATDPGRIWVVKEEHGYWDEQEKAFKNRAQTLYPNDPRFCVSLKEIHDEVKKQVMVRVRHGFKYQFEWDPFAPNFFRKFEIQPDGSRREYH